MYRLCQESPEIAQILCFGEFEAQKPKIGLFGENHENLQDIDVWEVIEASGDEQQ